MENNRAQNTSQSKIQETIHQCHRKKNTTFSAFSPSLMSVILVKTRIHFDPKNDNKFQMLPMVEMAVTMKIEIQ